METSLLKEYHAILSRKPQPIIINLMASLVRNWIPILFLLIMTHRQS
jgi:hypothetical protein